jgi:dipeptidyl aminopeptidase/acylaminoacyl peptidase
VNLKPWANHSVEIGKIGIRMLTIILTLGAICPFGRGHEKRAVCVGDAIAMTRLADPSYFRGVPADGKVGDYSPNGARFIVVVRKGDLSTDSNLYSIFLFETAHIFEAHRAKPLITMSTSTNRPGIAEVKWLADSQTLAFLGAPHDSPSQVYLLNVHTRRLVQKTHHTTSVEHFDISGDGKEVLFSAESHALSDSLTAQQHRDGVIIQNQSLEDLLGRRFNGDSGTETVFLQTNNELEIRMPPTHLVNKNSRLSLSQDGRYALVDAYFRGVRGEWSDYHNHVLEVSASRPARMGNDPVVYQLFLVDCRSGRSSPLIDAPAIYSAQYEWATDSKFVFVKSFLPLESVSSDERAQRAASELPSKIAVPSKSLERVSESEWKQALVVPKLNLPSISLEEGLNSPAKIVAKDLDQHRVANLLDLNPQLEGVRLGRVETLSFSVHGIPVEAALYLPPDYRPGTRYPLVIQTHGYDAQRFSMDGLDEWSSGFAARPLAAAGILVVQAQRFVNQEDHDRVGADRTLGTTVEQSFRNFMSLVYTQIVDELDRRSMTDKEKVGISGFSRTVWFVAYAMTHTNTHFSAVLLTDGIDGGYFDYIADRLTEFEIDNGGQAPFGTSGLQLWMDQAPGFSLDRVHMPLRLVAFRNPLSEWEMFIGLQLQGKPVELIELPDAEHLLEKPSDRQAAMQGMVDWFRFWLQGYRDPDPTKADEYERWQKMTHQVAEDRTLR